MILKEKHDIDELEIEIPNKNFFTNNFVIDIFVFIRAVILVITTIIIYAFCKHNKLRTLVVSLALQQLKEVSAVETKEEEYRCECTSQYYVIFSIKHSNNRISYIHSITG